MTPNLALVVKAINVIILLYRDDAKEPRET
jgi:hypothetical protein